ncbi:hypothetical protein [Variovorax sp. UC122_21]|uniref:hypothetical protein n=1 Tax=Variovorax sp. UC122_21 TaxID=3374554 RepID=UPI003757EED8
MAWQMAGIVLTSVAIALVFRLDARHGVEDEEADFLARHQDAAPTATGARDEARDRPRHPARHGRGRHRLRPPHAARRHLGRMGRGWPQPRHPAVLVHERGRGLHHLRGARHLGLCLGTGRAGLPGLLFGVDELCGRLLADAEDLARGAHRAPAHAGRLLRRALRGALAPACSPAWSASPRWWCTCRSSS